MELKQTFESLVGRVVTECSVSGGGYIGTPEVIQVMPVKQLPPGMSVEFLTAFLCYLEVDGKIDEFKFNVKLKDLSTKSGESTGEYLDAIEWVEGDCSISLGTEDYELMCTRIPWLSKYYDGPVVEFKPDGMELTLGYVPEKTILSFHFALAVARGLENDCADWMAVNIAHEKILDLL